MRIYIRCACVLQVGKGRRRELPLVRRTYKQAAELQIARRYISGTVQKAQTTWKAVLNYTVRNTEQLFYVTNLAQFGRLKTHTVGGPVQGGLYIYGV